MKFLVMNGVNLNLTGLREKSVYGNKTLEEINGEFTFIHLFSPPFTWCKLNAEHTQRNLVSCPHQVIYLVYNICTLFVGFYFYFSTSLCCW